MGVTGRVSKVSSVIAAICILVYIAAIAFGAVKIIDNIGERRNLAASEFDDLADRASSSAVFLGFMSESYQESVRDFLSSSETLLGIIVTDSNGEYAFERYPGSGIVWAGNSPRFKAAAGFSVEPFYLPIRVEGQRNVTIQATYSYIDSDVFLEALRNTLLAVLIALLAAFIALLLELTVKNGYRVKAPGKPAAKPETAENADSGDFPSAATPDSASESPPPDDGFFSDPRIETDAPLTELDFGGEGAGSPFGNANFDEAAAAPEAIDLSFDPAEEISEASPGPAEAGEGPDENSPEKERPQGLFTPRGNIGWKSYTRDRLASELHRCASFEQDLAFLAMEFRGDESLSDDLYRQFADEAVSFFTMRDLIFEEGEKGISVIVPSADLEQGKTKAEEFYKRITAKLPESFMNRKELCIGLSTRSGRLIDADRLMLEAFTGLDKAINDPISHIVAFSSDLEKYRNFIKRSRRS